MNVWPPTCDSVLSEVARVKAEGKGVREVKRCSQVARQVLHTKNMKENYSHFVVGLS